MLNLDVKENKVYIINGIEISQNKYHLAADSKETH